MVYKRVQLDKKILLFKISHGYASNMIYYFIFLLHTESMVDRCAKNRIFLSQPDAGNGIYAKEIDCGHKKRK